MICLKCNTTYYTDGITASPFCESCRKLYQQEKQKALEQHSLNMFTVVRTMYFHRAKELVNLITSHPEITVTEKDIDFAEQMSLIPINYTEKQQAYINGLLDKFNKFR